MVYSLAALVTIDSCRHDAEAIERSGGRFRGLFSETRGMIAGASALSINVQMKLVLVHDLARVPTSKFGFCRHAANKMIADREC
jgi:hypothetical protein